MGGRHPSGPATRNEAAMLSMSLKSLSKEEPIEEPKGEEVVTHSVEVRVGCQVFVSGVSVSGFSVKTVTFLTRVSV